MYSFALFLFERIVFNFFYDRMKHRNLLFIQTVLILIMSICGIILYNKLPDPLATHRNAYWVADEFQSKSIFQVFVFPFFAIGFMILMKVMPFLDPRKKKYEQFSEAYECIETIIIGFIAYFYAGFLLYNLNIIFQMGSFLFLWFGLFLIFWGNYASKVRWNYFLGRRTPWTLENEEVWNKTQRFAGKLAVISGFSCLINAFFLFQPIVHIIIIFIVLFLPCFYSYRLYNKVVKN